MRAQEAGSAGYQDSLFFHVFKVCGDRLGNSSTANTLIMVTHFPHTRYFKKITAIEDSLVFQCCGNFIEIRCSEYAPFCGDNQRIRLVKAGVLMIGISYLSPTTCFTFSMASGSNTVTVAPAASSASMIYNAGASRISSVLGLKASPHKAKCLPFRSSLK